MITYEDLLASRHLSTAEFADRFGLTVDEEGVCELPVQFMGELGRYVVDVAVFDADGRIYWEY